MRSLSLKKSRTLLVYMFTNGFNRRPYQIYKWQKQNWEGQLLQIKIHKEQGQHQQDELPNYQ